jgi:hypothetical protein
MRDNPMPLLAGLRFHQPGDAPAAAIEAAARRSVRAQAGGIARQAQSRQALAAE